MIVNSRWLLGAAFALSAAPGLSQAVEASQSNGTTEDSAETRNAECAARKFETIVEVMVGGERRGRKITICGEPDQTDAEWEVTLRDAIEKLEAGAGLPADAREAAIAAIEAEIASLHPPSALPPREAEAPPSPTASATEAPAPAPALTPTWKGAPAGGAVAPPTAPSAPVAVAPAAAAPPMKVVNKPRLTIRCMIPGDRGSGGPCITVQRDTILTVTADEDLARGTSLIFVRRGTARGEAALGQMRRGQTLRLTLPQDVCRGVLRDRLEIQVRAAGAGQAADALGPFPLRC